MIRNALKNHLNRARNDEGISPVIGTILMVAATVIIGGAVYAAVNAYSGRAAKPATDASFKAQALDTDGDGKEDTIKLTYLAGPSNAEPGVKVQNATSTALVPASPAPSSWNPGDFATYTKPAAQACSSSAPCTVFVTVSLGESTTLDQTLQLKE
jgi:flagellin-like protein